MARTEYICTYCGKKEIRPESLGRPQPGDCPRKEREKNGKMKPHSWRINRKLS